MIEYVRDWYERHFSHPQAVLLVVFLGVGLAVVLFLGKMLAPLLASIVIAYLLEASVQSLERRGLGRLLAVTIVFCAFLAVLAFLVIGLAPIVSRQLSNFLHELPHMISHGRQVLLRLPETYPNFISATQIDLLINAVRGEINAFGQNVVSLSLASIPVLLTLLVYLILGPVLVFFFLKDKAALIAWLTSSAHPTRRAHRSLA